MHNHRTEADNDINNYSLAELKTMLHYSEKILKSVYQIPFTHKEIEEQIIKKEN